MPDIENLDDDDDNENFRKLVRETHEAVMEIKTIMRERCPGMIARVSRLETTIDGNGGEGLRSRMHSQEQAIEGVVVQQIESLKWLRRTFVMVLTTVLGLVAAIGTYISQMGHGH